MRNEQQESQICTPVVKGSYKPDSGIHVDITNTGMSHLWGRIVKLGQQRTGNHGDYEAK